MSRDSALTIFLPQSLDLLTPMMLAIYSIFQTLLPIQVILKIKDGELAVMFSFKSQPKSNVNLSKCNGSISQRLKLAECTIHEIQSNQNSTMAA